MPKQSALEKKEALEAERARKAADDAERQEAASWAVGAKDNSRQKDLEDKEALKRQKAADKAALLAADEESLSSIVKTGKPKKAKGKDDFAMLNAALANQPKTKAQKEADAKKAEAEERKRKEAEIREQKEAQMKAEADYIKAQAARGIVVNHTDDLFIPLNNKLEEDDEEYEEQGTGLDAAVDALNIASGSMKKKDEHPERRQKVSDRVYSIALRYLNAGLVQCLCGGPAPHLEGGNPWLEAVSVQGQTVRDVEEVARESSKPEGLSCKINFIFIIFIVFLLPFGIRTCLPKIFVQLQFGSSLQHYFGGCCSFVLC